MGTAALLIKSEILLLTRTRLYQQKVDVDMLNAVRNVLADSSVSISSEQFKFKFRAIALMK